MLRDRPAPASILVVDDQEAVSRLLKHWLEHLGFTVRLVTSGEQALCAVWNRQTPTDLILADVSMPGMNGLELARLVLTDYPGRQVILMARRAGQLGDRVQVRGRPVTVLPKPLDLDRLLDLLRVMLPPLLPADESEPPRRVASRERLPTSPR